MDLRQLEIGKTAVVTAVGGDGALRQHFLDMGIMPSAEIVIVKYAPHGGRVEVRIHGYSTLPSSGEELDVPVYLHPGLASSAISERYLKGSWSAQTAFIVIGCFTESLLATLPNNGFSVTTVTTVTTYTISQYAVTVVLVMACKGHAVSGANQQSICLQMRIRGYGERNPHQVRQSSKLRKQFV